MPTTRRRRGDVRFGSDRTDPRSDRCPPIAMSKYFLAIGAAICFGIASALQHRAARSVPVAGISPIRLLLRLFRNRLWVIGRAADTAAVVLQALALRLGSLVAIQSI